MKKTPENMFILINFHVHKFVGGEKKTRFTVKAALVEVKRNTRNIILSICFRLVIITACMEFDSISCISDCKSF